MYCRNLVTIYYLISIYRSESIQHYSNSHLDNNYTKLYDLIESMIATVYGLRPDCRQLLDTMTEWAIDGQVVTQMTDGLNDRLIAIKSRETYIRVNTFET